jgi:hypothetical protein
MLVFAGLYLLPIPRPEVAALAFFRAFALASAKQKRSAIAKAPSVTEKKARTHAFSPFAARETGFQGPNLLSGEKSKGLE